ncbi:flagellar hook-associated protein 1 FlgK [Halanaerobium congolense]|jgi:flagellar hook-associated protein 1 FlgK|uniref:Flagellar hook-associated protein 1 n=1 Tax=Halanaerobium congolense TaxID=54121 RepID=A0A1G8NYZ0_9FIRM|nr:flagellar hook-associated protein FlgK [Halanaerobium congolense]KXS48331.1 MAG: flagellar hook-associated protein 1 FlgK [Halanaerobium sp. T82-1]PUU89022.1 MAG: flagellar hook-associated protein 1 FlgK [Halanaerobium sp.]SDI85325.1 flagellar hook-associated protein 1 FlgK [Halanaerobium congolense]SET55760.1 flagellar hook-associated protein 1 FlgK [Halanaerobium congolense]
MNNIFSGLHLGLRALETQRKSLDVTGHNIANANNEDYNKQRAIHKASYPYTAPGLSNHGGAGQFGTGVEIERVERVKDQFINSQIFNETQTAGYWNEKQRGLEKIEYIFNEPSDSGIDTAMDQFWNSLQDLSNNPSDDAARNMVRENARNLVDSFQSVESQLVDYKESIDQNLNNAAASINEITTKIADLNKQIVSVKGSGQSPNDLLDERDALYKDLNSMLDVQSREDDQGNLIISADGKQIVNGSDAYELEIIEDPDNADKKILGHKKTGSPINVKNGKIKAWMEVRDTIITDKLDKLNKLAEDMVTDFNEQHRAGYDAEGKQGKDFFAEITNSDKAVSQLALTDEIDNPDGGLAKIAAGNTVSDLSVVGIEKLDSSDADGKFEIDIATNGDDYDVTVTNLDTGEVSSTKTVTEADDLKIGFNAETNSFETDLTAGDFIITANSKGTATVDLGYSIGNGENANALSDIFNQDGNNVKSDFRKIITSVGAESSRAQKMVNNQEVVLKQLNTLDRSISGVSLDEEMANLIKYQQSYAAAAKYINKTEELLDSLMTIV